MSASEPAKTPPPDAAGGDPSMEDILASIRRILSEDEAPADTPGPHGADRPGEHPHPAELPPQEWQREAHEARPAQSHHPMPPAPRDAVVMAPDAFSPAPPPDLLVLDASMRIPDPAPDAALPEPPIPPSVSLMNPETTNPATLVAPAVAAAAANSVGSLVRNIVADRAAQVHAAGPTLEDVVREELRPLLKQWLDEHLPVMVERLVRVELERVIGRAAT